LLWKNGENENGYSHNIYFGKQWSVSTLMCENYETKILHRDLGYFTNNNFLDHMVGKWIGQNWYNRIFKQTEECKLFTRFVRNLPNSNSISMQRNTNKKIMVGGNVLAIPVSKRFL
jgi:hypothetical protein